MNRRGVGPNQLGSPLKLTDPPKKGRQYPNPNISKADIANASETYFAGNEADFNSRPKATGGIEVDNTLESLLIGGPLVKAGAKAAASAGRLGGKIASSSRAVRNVGRVAEAGDAGHVVGLY